MKAKLAIVGCGNPAQKWHLPTLHTCYGRKAHGTDLAVL